MNRNEIGEEATAAMYLATVRVIFSGEYDDLTCAQARDKIAEIAAEILDPPEGPPPTGSIDTDIPW